MYAAFVKYTRPITPRAKIAIPTHIGMTKNIPYLYEAVTYFSSRTWSFNAYASEVAGNMVVAREFDTTSGSLAIGSAAVK